MPVLTLTPDTLIVQSAYPDPPFDIMENGTATGFDIELMRAVCKELHLAMRPVAYTISTASSMHWPRANAMR